ncbi:MAG: T9SS type A sorting domain-containing protein [Bacteroidia bacterium]
MRALLVFLLFSFHLANAQAQLDTLLIPSFPNLQTFDLNRKTDMLVLSSNEIWIGLQREGILRFQSGTWSRIFTGDTITDIPDDYIYKMHLDPQGNIWMGHRLGLSKFDGANWSHIPFDSLAGFLPQYIFELESNSNSILLGGNKGFYILDLSSQTWSSYRKSNSTLLCDSIRAIEISATGEIWLGTDSGLCVLSSGSFTNYSSKDMGIPKSTILEIKFNSTDTLLLAKGRGIYQFQNGKLSSIDSLLHGVQVSNFCSSPMYQLSLENIYQSNPHNFIYRPEEYLFGDSNLYYLYSRENYLNYQFPTSQILFQINQNLKTLISTLWEPLNTTKNCILPRIHNDTIYLASLDYNINSSIIKHPLHPSAFKKFDLLDTLFIGTNNSIQVIRASHVAAWDSAFLHANKIRAQLLNRGDLHWNPVQQLPGYEVNPGSHKVSTYCSALWLGGYDQNGQLYTAAQTYRQSGANDFWPGPLNANGIADSTSNSNFDSIWMVRRSDVDEFRYQYALGNVSNGTFQVSNFILTWPSKINDPLITQTLAPFVDFNNDGLYNPYDGDYPDVKGDQMAWWVFNDQFGIKSETNSLPMGVEINASAYSLNCNNSNPILDYTTFYHYEIHNRSTNDYDSCFIGMWSDFDLGNASDDHVGCHVTTNSFFVYNGDSIDDGGGGFGTCPPIQNIVLLQGPEAYSNDGIDNNHDGWIDELNENNGMNSFHYYIGINNLPISNPSTSDDFYEYLTARWQNGQPVTYGGDGYSPNAPGATNIPCHFMFPGNSDPNFSTPWTMDIVSSPTDVRGVGSSGPFLLPAGSHVTFDVAYLTGPHDSIQNRVALEELNQLFRSGKLDSWRGALPPIYGPQTINTSTLSAIYTIPLPSDTSFHYLWTVTNGIILNGQGSNTIEVFWGITGVGDVLVEVLETGNPCKGSKNLYIEINSPMSIDTPQEFTIRLYPNPVRSILNIETGGEIINEIQIYSIEGLLIMQTPWTEKINTQSLSPGVYIIELNSNENRKLLRKVFIKQ